ncbi:hypothetical protein V8E54_002259 [Elaphomyces granulatus]
MCLSRRGSIELNWPWLEKILGYFASAGYDASSEAYCRVPIDCVLTAAKLAFCGGPSFQQRRSGSGLSSPIVAVTYLAIMKVLHRQKFKRNDFVQGFYADGSLFRFVAIDSDGSILASRFYERRYDLLHIFNRVCTMIEAAARCEAGGGEARKLRALSG